MRRRPGFPPGNLCFLGAHALDKEGFLFFQPLLLPAPTTGVVLGHEGELMPYFVQGVLGLAGFVVGVAHP